MNYKLALDLKNEGFPQRKEWDEGYFYCVDCEELQLFKNDPDEGNFVGEDYGHRWKDWPEKNWITVPTLEELIDALNTPYIRLAKDTDDHETIYLARIKGVGDFETEGKSFLEAVAKAYLKLNTN